MANGHIPTGEYTYVVEGHEDETSVLHFPEFESGVTIGKGYDMGSRRSSDIYSDMISIGMKREDALIVSQASGLHHAEARNFTKDNKNKIARIDKSQKIKLFNKIWPDYITDAKRLYTKLVPNDIKESDINKSSKTNLVWKKTKWDELQDRIQDMLVDLRYQGKLRGKIAKVASKNDAEYLAKFIENNSDLQPFERARRRADYLRGKYTPKGF